MHSYLLKETTNQKALFADIITKSTSFKSTMNRDRLKLVLEELTSNFFYHSFRNRENHDKYDRLKEVSLEQSESLVLRFSENPQGIYVCFEDNSGSLRFEDIAQRLTQGYHNQKESQFEDKHQGAGLGFYLVFETATHFLVTISPNKRTSVSIWLSPMNQHNPKLFSFNFFEEPKYE